MASDYYVFNSFKNFIKNISGINAIVYSDNKIDLTQVYTVTPKVDLVGTELNFIIINTDTSAALISNNTELLLNRYVRFVSPSSTQDDKNIRITAYNNLTGEITIESAFGEAVTTTDSFNIEVLDSIFIRPINKQTIGGQSRFSNRFIRFDMIIKTKEDSSKLKTLTFQDLITSKIGQYRNAEIKNQLDVVIGSMNFSDEPEYRETTEDGSQFIKYLGSVPCNYYVDNFG